MLKLVWKRDENIKWIITLSTAYVNNSMGRNLKINSLSIKSTPTHSHTTDTFLHVYPSNGQELYFKERSVKWIKLRDD